MYRVSYLSISVMRINFRVQSAKKKKKNEIKAKYEISYAFKLFVLSSETPRFYKMFTDETSMHIFSVVSGSKI